MLALVNKARQQEGVKPLQFSQELEDAAQRKSEDEAGQTVRLRPDEEEAGHTLGMHPEVLEQLARWEARHYHHLRGSRGEC